MKNNKRVLIITLIAVSAIMAGLLYFLFSNRIIDPVTPNVPDVVQTDEKLEQYRKIWSDNKNINEDYVGELFFDSGLINVSFVQAKSCYKSNGEMYKFYTENGNIVTDPSNYTGNDVYIWTNWKTGAYDYNDEGGSVFMDYRNEINDENLVIYGHHFSEWNDETRKKAFTPLEQLMDESNYKANKFVTLVLEHEIRHYELVSVYQFNALLDSHWDDFQYWRTEYRYDDYTGSIDDDYYARYIEAVKNIQLYDTGVDLTTKDKTLTLQTCVSGHTGELFEILVLKQLNVEKY